jgi:hypothetical protein
MPLKSERFSGPQARVGKDGEEHGVALLSRRAHPLDRRRRERANFIPPRQPRSSNQPRRVRRDPLGLGRTITTQFEFITRAWTNNPNFPQPGTGPDPLRAIETVLCGGYFFVPPITNANQPWTFTLPSAA